MLNSVKLIQNYLKTIPEKPGIYKMLDSNDQCLYIGKAKNLAKRIASYTNFNKLSNRIQLMISNIGAIEITITNTETEALLLECDLIKTLKPRYNILLRDDKTFPYILIHKTHSFPQITKYRGKKNKKDLFLGPFASTRYVEEAIVQIQKLFLLRNCSDSFFAARKRPCLQYQIKRCSAPCVGKISQEDYKNSIEQAIEFIKGNAKSVVDLLKQEMQKASNELQFERAAVLRDRIAAIKHLASKQQIQIKNFSDIDIFSINHDSIEFCITVLILRNSQHCGQHHYFFKFEDDINENSLLSDFIMQFYNHHECPNYIATQFNLADHSIILEALSKKFHLPKFKIHKLNKNEKNTILQHMIENSQNALKQRRIRGHIETEILIILQEQFNLPSLPKHIEIFDNSHISGTHALGAMVVFENSSWNKKLYRIYKYNGTMNDDYALLRYSITKRLKQLQEEASQWPDLWLIDGGLGHLNIVIETIKNIMPDKQDKFNIIAIAKGEKRQANKEKYYIIGKNTPIYLAENDKLHYFLQNLRNEAHRFAITNYRKKHLKSMRSSEIKYIPGIGKQRQIALLNHFGSIEKIKSASLEELSQIPIIGTKLAQKIFSYFIG